MRTATMPSALASAVAQCQTMPLHKPVLPQLLAAIQAVSMNISQNKRLSGLVLLGYLAASCAAALMGSYFTSKVIITDFYAGLSKPAWAPPGWLFAPVWTVLYVCMSLAAWQVWKRNFQRPSRAYATAHAGWWAQLALNAVWPVFFWVQPAGIAPFLACAVLAVAVWACVAVMHRISMAAAALMLPYACWVSFATALSWALWRMNAAI